VEDALCRAVWSRSAGTCRQVVATTDAWVSAMTKLEVNDTLHHCVPKVAGATIRATAVPS
jgi:hypothetical protein